MTTLEEIAQLCESVYQPYPSVVGDWRLAAVGKCGGFFGGAFTNTSQDLVVAYRGTDDLQDWIESNSLLALKLTPVQMNPALSFLDAAASCNVHDRIIVAGHSLGGFLAKGVALRRGILGVAFNAPGVKHLVTDGVGPKILNVVVQGDVISKVGASVDPPELLPMPRSRRLALVGLIGMTAATSLERHSMRTVSGALQQSSRFRDRDVGELLEQ